MKKTLLFMFATLIFTGNIFAGTVTGQIQTPSTGRGVANGTLTFTLTQAAVISGTAAVASNANCWTDTSGNVVGLPGDAAIAAPVLSSNLGSGSLGSGTYFVRYTWANATGESQPGAERSLALGSTGTLIVQAPVNVPGMATSMKVYIGAAAGAETLQGSVAVTNGVLAGNYSQSAALVAGASLPSTNTSACQIRFNDELQPSYTGYNVALTNVNGAGIAGFPQKWYLSGGSNGTVNLSQGTPLYSGVVQYPQAIVASPAANGQQSINGPLNLNGFALSNAPFAGVGPWVDIGVYGARCDGTTDDTSALQSAINFLGSNGGGTVLIPPKTCKIPGQIVIPNDGGNPPRMKGGSIRITGAGGGGVIDNGGAPGTVGCTGGSILDMQVNSSFGKIQSFGLGVLEIEHICFKDSSGVPSDNGQFIFVTLTTLRFHHNQIDGNHLAIPLNDGIQAGGTGLTTSGTNNDMCQGYGSVISDNQFNYVRRAVLLRNECNSYNVERNHIFFQSSNAAGGLIELDPGSGSTQATGNYIVGNLCEVTNATKYCVNLVQNSIANFIAGNTCWDLGGSVVACVNTQGAGNGNNRIYCGYANDNGSPVLPNTVKDSDVEYGCGPVIGQTLITKQTGSTATFTGNSANQVIYSYTIPGNTIKSGKGLRVKIGWFKAAGSASATYKVNLGGSIVGGNLSGGTTLFSWPSTGVGGTGAQCCGEYTITEITNDPGLQNAQHNVNFLFAANGVGPGAPLAITDTQINANTSAVDFTQNQLLTFTFNVVNTDQAVGTYLLVEHIR